jgi:hypothetical protein
MPAVMILFARLWRSTASATAAVVLFLSVPLSSAQAQSAVPSSNVVVFQRLAAECLAPLVSEGGLVLEAPARMAFLTAGLVRAWQQQEVAVYMSEEMPLPRVWYVIEEAGVRYAPAGRGLLDREVALTLRFTVTEPGGRLLHDDRCEHRFTDRIRRQDRAMLESDIYPETVGSDPPPHWIRRYGEPAVLVAATAVTTWLFFNLRTQSNR